MTDEFLDYSKHVGNDLSTPIMEYNFPGLKKMIIGAYVLQGGKRHF